MNDINSRLYHAYMSMLGYKKVPLHDSKGVLNLDNNFKYYRESLLHNKSITVLPSGTKVIYKIDDMDTFSNSKVNETMIIRKKSGVGIKSIRELGKKDREIIQLKPQKLISKISSALKKLIK